MKFLSKEWLEGHQALLQAEFSKKSRVKTKLVEIYEDCPDGKTRWIYYSLKDGLLEEFKSDEGNDLPEATFRCYGKYESYVKVLTGEISPKASLMDGTFTLEGNMMKALAMLGVYNRISKCKDVEGTVY